MRIYMNTMETTSAEEQQPRREPEIYIGRHNASIEAISIGETDVNLSKGMYI